MDPKKVEEILNLQPPPKLNDRLKRINDRRNRNMIKAMIINLIQRFAGPLGQDPENFGLAQLKVKNSFYFYGVVFDKAHRYGRLIDINSFPTTFIKDVILAFAETYAPTAAGVYVCSDELEFLYVDHKGMYRSKEKK